MSKYIKLMDLIDTDCILLGEVECDDCPFYDKERIWCRLIEWINSLPTIEASEDCISREYLLSKVYDMDNDNLVVDLKDIENAPSVVPSCQKNRQVERAEGEPQTENIKVTCDMVGSKNEIEYQLPKCEKCINYGVEFTEDDSIDTCLIDECHYEPKDEQSSKVGRWVTEDYYHNTICSNCGAKETEFIYGTENWYGVGESKFCPNCGAKMKGAKE